MLGRLRRLLRDLERSVPPAGPGPGERARWDWYGDSCPCGVEVGTCREHPRARPAQRPPDGEWRAWLFLAGRASGKTRSAAEWIRSRAESDPSARLALVGPTAADVRDTMVEGESGLLAVSPPWSRPRYEPSKRRLTWPNGARATTFSADEPERLRGPQHTGAWCDELGSWRYPAAMENLLLGLRLGDDPRLIVSTTPRAVPLVVELAGDPTTVLTRGTTYDNRPHLAAGFFERIVGKFEGTRLGDQELNGELLEVSDGQWFTSFDKARHVTAEAEYLAGWPVHCYVDFGASRHAAAIWLQVRGYDRRRVAVVGDWYAEGHHSASAAEAILEHGHSLPFRGFLDSIRLDPYGVPREGMGQTAFEEFRRTFAGTSCDRWPTHRVLDGLDQLEVMLDRGLLIIHPRCEHLIKALQTYRRRRSSGGAWLDEPEDPQHPAEDLVDALRGGVRDRFPEVRTERGAGLRRVEASGFRGR